MYNFRAKIPSPRTLTHILTRVGSGHNGCDDVTYIPLTPTFTICPVSISL